MNQQSNSEATSDIDKQTYKDITMAEEHTFGAGLLPYYAKKKWVDGREAFIEFYFKLFHTILFTIFMVINSLVALSSLLLYFNQYVGAENGIEALRILLPTKLGAIASFLSFIYIPLDHRPLFWLLSLFFVYFCWCYSTVTQPIKDKKGRKTYINYVSPKGRKGVLIITLVQIYLIYSGLFAWYMRDLTFDFFNKIQVTDKPYLKITSLAGLTNVLNIIPIVICLITAFLIVREFYKTPDIKDRFLEWTFGLLSNQSYTLRGGQCDVIVGYEKTTNKPIILVEIARYLHTLIVGSTGTGKSSTQLLPVIAQDLIRLARGKKLGVVVLEPKGDLIRDVEAIAKELKIDESLIKIVDPTDKDSKLKINPLAGPMDTAANLWAGTLDALSGDQDKFFKDQQSEVATNYVMLGKIRHGEKFHFIHHLQQMYSDARFLADMVEEVRIWLDKTMDNPDLTHEEHSVLHNYNLICEYFEMDVLQYMMTNDKEGQQPVLYPFNHKHAGKPVVTNKKDKFIAGAKKYVNDISLNPLLSNLFIAREGDIFVDIDEFLDKGGILLFNSALGELEELSLIFGQFIIRQFQSSVFRRPPQKDGYTRIPIFFNVDEFPLYINEAFERLLTLGRSFLVGTTTAVQSLGQIQAVKNGFERIIIGNSNNKFVFGRGELQDNKYFSEHFGEDYVLDESSNESTTPFSMPDQSVGVRHNIARTLQPRFTPTQIKELKFKNYIAEIVDAEGSIMKPVHAYGLFLNETNFLKKFAKIGDIELKTKDYKPLNFKGNISQLKYLVNSLEQPSPKQPESPLQENGDKIEDHTLVEQDIQPVSHEADSSEAATTDRNDETVPYLIIDNDSPYAEEMKSEIYRALKQDDTDIHEKNHSTHEPSNQHMEDDDLLFWPDTVDKQVTSASDTSAVPAALHGELISEAGIEQNEEENQTISVPNNLDSIIQSIEDSLGTTIAHQHTEKNLHSTEDKTTVKKVIEDKDRIKETPVLPETASDNISSQIIDKGDGLTKGATSLQSHTKPYAVIDDEYQDIFSLVATDRNVPNKKNEQSQQSEIIPTISESKDDL